MTKPYPHRYRLKIWRQDIPIDARLEMLRGQLSYAEENLRNAEKEVVKWKAEKRRLRSFISRLTNKQNERHTTN